MTSVKRSARKAGRAVCVAAALGALISAGPLFSDTISCAPASPNVEQQVKFTYNPVVTPAGPLRWDFGDGKTYLAPSMVFVAYHTYVAPGFYTVRAQAQAAGFPPPLVTKAITVVERRSVAFSPPNPVAAQPVTFVANNFFSASLRWAFDDAPPFNGGPRQVHAFRSAGMHKVVVRDWDGKSVAGITAQVPVGLTPAIPSITFAPAEPRVNDSVEFRAVNFTSTALVRWDFGDGMVANDTTPPVISHVYRSPGTYSVRAFDGGATTPAARVEVRVLPERIITFSPPDPRVGEEITFLASHFRSPNLRWDFGDGFVLSAGAQVTHAFGTAGPWTIRAYDLGAPAEVPKSLSLTVFPAQGARAAFSISFIQLRFEDGKAYKVIPRQFDALTAFAEIKFEGTGVLQAQWLVDGMPFKTVFTSLSFAGTTIIDSGKVPGLPSLIPGLHEVALSLMQPRAEFVIPVIRYFVTADAEPRPAVDFLLDGAVTIDGAVLGGDEATIEAPVGEHFLVKGWVRNESGGAVACALLRVFLDDVLVDQKIVLDLKPGEERRFESSVLNPTAGRKRLLLALYDISRRPAAILYLKELSVVPPR
jgi:PKD repeat protein